jgi:KUP system potassium uptake protein
MLSESGVIALIGRIFPDNPSPSKEDVVGAVSCIIWALTLVPLIKYCWIVLRAGDDQGEGLADPSQEL